MTSRIAPSDPVFDFSKCPVAQQVNNSPLIIITVIFIIVDGIIMIITIITNDNIIPKTPSVPTCLPTLTRTARYPASHSDS